MNALERRIRSLEARHALVQPEQSYEVAMKREYFHDGKWDSGFNFDALIGQTPKEKLHFLIDIANGTSCDPALFYEIRELVKALDGLDQRV